MSQFCFFKNKEYSIEYYINNIDKFNGAEIVCKNSHTLIFANGKIRKPYFRHINQEDTGGSPITYWHSEWQSNFPNTEVIHCQKNSNQKKERRADVELDKNRILELQHSFITKEEVCDRMHDYEIHGKKIIWLIHANGAVIVKHFEQSGRVYLEFNSEFWKYESFVDYDYIYLDIESKIYKFSPSKVKSHMIDVETPKDKQDFINALKNGEELWTDIDPEQCTLFINQQGAGNGKTFGIIQMLESDEVSHYNTFIFVTKQHSAKTVIKNEFEHQVENGLLKYISEATVEDINKKYIINFRNEKTGKEPKIIIATIDSLMYNIGNTNHTFFDKFQGIIDSIIDDHINTNKEGTIKYAGLDPKLNKETLLFIDEAQDLTINYAQAIINIMRNKYVDAYIVGDKLQSISHEENAFTYLYDNEFPSIKVNKIKPTNVCRRFINPHIIRFVNEMIPFKKYDLPEVKPYKEDSNGDASPIVFFEGHSIYHSDNDDKINKEVEKIMAHFKNEVEQNNRSPKDFLIITPFTSNNPLVDALQGYIDTFWKERIAKEKNEFFRYAIFHKSEEGSSINLDESNESTRIVSIHSSKGDGRNVVFMIGFSESALKRFSIKSNNSLIYDSLFHVAITRMKQRLYIQYLNNGDKISQNFNKYTCNDLTTPIMPNIHIFSSFKYTEVVNSCSNIYFSEFTEKIIAQSSLEKIVEEKSDKRIVDANNHAIRYSSLLITLLINIVNKETCEIKKENSEIKRQVRALLHKIAESNINEVNGWQKYYTVINVKEIAIVKIADRGRDYLDYHRIIKHNMESIKDKLSKNLKEDIIPHFCPFECVILNHMLGIKRKGAFTEITINDIYNIVDIYSNSYEKDTKGHEHCLCNKFFNKSKTVAIKNNNIDKMKEYLHEHFDKVKYISHCLNAFHDVYPKINWLYNHVIKYNGKNKNYKLWKNAQLIGYDNENVIIAYMKPQFNSLNYNEILINSIYDTYLIKNIEEKTTNELGVEVITENYKRFSGKNIISCVFTLDRETPYYISWKDDGIDLIDTNADLLKITIYKYLKNHYSLENNGLYYFYNYWRNNCSSDQKGPTDFINFLIDKYNENKNRNEKENKKFPSYIDEFLNFIKCKIEFSSDKNAKKKILSDYDNKEYFMAELEKKLDDSVKRYFNMYDNDDSEDDSD